MRSLVVSIICLFSFINPIYSGGTLYTKNGSYLVSNQKVSTPDIYSANYRNLMVTYSDSYESLYYNYAFNPAAQPRCYYCGNSYDEWDARQEALEDYPFNGIGGENSYLYDNSCTLTGVCASPWDISIDKLCAGSSGVVKVDAGTFLFDIDYISSMNGALYCDPSVGWRMSSYSDYWDFQVVSSPFVEGGQCEISTSCGAGGCIPPTSPKCTADRVTRCANGYYMTNSTEHNIKCAKCPNNPPANSSALNNITAVSTYRDDARLFMATIYIKNITNCYIPSGTNATDESGAYQMTGNCFYTQ